MSESESSWPDEAWLDPIVESVRRRARRSPGGAESVFGGSSVSGSSVDQMRQDIRNLNFYIGTSDDSRSATPVPYDQRRKNHIREERRWTRLYQVLNEEVQRKLVNLRLKINAMTDVARLPTEILCQIFIIMANDASIKTHYHLLTITQVCRHWRKVAIGLPMLWTSLYPSMSVRDVARSLRRSNGLALDFTISGTQGTAGHWEHFHEHIGRCKKITIKEIPPEWIADLQPWLDNAAPILKELILSAVPSQSPINSELELTFFDQTTPRLRRDALIERYGTEPLPYFKTYPPDYKPSRVDLPLLRRLCVQGMAPIELTWMEYLDIPISCCIKIGIDLATHSGLAPLLAVLENPSKGLRPLMRAQETMFTGSSAMTSRSDRDKLGVHLWDPDSQLACAIVFRGPQSREQTELIIWMMCMTLFKRYTPRCIAWSMLTNRFLLGPGIYIRVLMAHTTITDLAFDDCHFVTDALKLLLASERSASTPYVPSGPGTALEVVCPNLAYLALERCQQLPGSVVLDLARARDTRGKTLRKLRVRECENVIARNILDLRWHVEEVEWDGDRDWDGFSTMADLDPEEAALLMNNEDWRKDFDEEETLKELKDEVAAQVEPMARVESPEQEEDKGSDEEEEREPREEVPSKKVVSKRLSALGAARRNQSLETVTDSRRPTTSRRSSTMRQLVSDTGE